MMLGSELFKSRGKIQSVSYLPDVRKVHDFVPTLNTSHQESFNNHLQKSYDLSRNLNNNFSSDKILGLRTSSSNSRSNSFINFRMPEKNQVPNSYIKNPFIYDNIDHCKNQLIHTQSMSAIHSHQRIHMLTKINTLLQNHSKRPIPTHQNPQFTSIKKSSQIHHQIHHKIDRLESYLHKIKHQRNKEKNPTHKIQSQAIKIPENPQRLPATKEQKAKFDMTNVFKELDKLKVQIGRVREQAIEVQKRNSVSRDKSLKTIEVEPNFNKIKQQMHKLKTLHSKIRPSSPPKVNQNDKLTVLPMQRVNQSAQLIVQRSHTNSFQNLNLLTHHTSFFAPRPSNPVKSQSLKPKITFSFATQK